jgi:hypothetical protein
VRALRHREGHDAVDTQGGEEKRDDGEADEEDESEAVVGETNSRTSSIERGSTRAISGSTEWTGTGR